MADFLKTLSVKAIHLSHFLMLLYAAHKNELVLIASNPDDCLRQ